MALTVALTSALNVVLMFCLICERCQHLPWGHNTVGQSVSGEWNISRMQYVVERFGKVREMFWTHSWHVGLSRAKELCILPTRGNKERWSKKKSFPLLQATVTWQPPRNLKYHSAAAYIRDLCERHGLLAEMLPLTRAYILTVCKTFRNTPQREEGGRLLSSPRKQETVAFVLDVVSISAEQNDDVHF